MTIGWQDEDPCANQSQDDHVIAESAGDLKKDMVLESVVKRLQEASTTQMESYGFCGIIASMALHDFAMYELTKKAEDLRVGLYLAIATIVTISPNYLKLFIVIRLVPDTLKSNLRLYCNMKALEQSERLKKPLSKNCPRMRVDLSKFYKSKFEKTFGVEALEWAIYHGEEAVTSVPSGHNQHNLDDRLGSVYGCTSAKQYWDQGKIAAHEGLASHTDGPSKSCRLPELSSNLHFQSPNIIRSLRSCRSPNACPSGISYSARG